jgi:dTDP-4-amino-4,6-dideoxygalactose transaminase
LDFPEFLRAGVSLFAEPRRQEAFAPSLRAFEESLALYAARKHAVVVGSGKLALALILENLGFPPSSEVILPGFLVPEVVAVVLAAGLKPVIVDVHPDTFNLDVERVQAAMGPNTRAILAVHLFGTPCDVQALSSLASQRNAVVIEDAAQALGATSLGRPAGSFGRCSTLSFGLYKNLNTVFGGAILTDDDGLAEAVGRQARRLPLSPRTMLFQEWLRWAGLSVATHPAVFQWLVGPSINALEALSGGLVREMAYQPPPEYTAQEMDLSRIRLGFWSWQARLGRRQFRDLEAHTQIRCRNAEILDEALRGIDGIVVQKIPPGVHSIRLNYPVRVEHRDRVLRVLRGKTPFDLAPGYLMNLSKVPAFAPYARSTPVSEAMEKGHFYIPVWPDIHGEVYAEMAEKLARELRRAL